jgi:hypothetical protein
MNGYKIAICEALWPMGLAPARAESGRILSGSKQAALNHRYLNPSRAPIPKQAELLGLCREHQMK